MPYTPAGKNLMLDALGDRALYVSLHRGAPGNTGANELTGGTPAYGRQAITWANAVDGEMDDDVTSLLFNVPGGSTVESVGLWTAATGGTFLGYDDVTPESYAGQGRYELTGYTLDLNAG